MYFVINKFKITSFVNPSYLFGIKKKNGEQDAVTIAGIPTYSTGLLRERILPGEMQPGRVLPADCRRAASRPTQTPTGSSQGRRSSLPSRRRWLSPRLPPDQCHLFKIDGAHRTSTIESPLKLGVHCISRLSIQKKKK